METKDWEKLFSLIRETKICMMTTTDSEGYLVSRPMANQSDYPDHNLWFFTDRNSGKVEELQKNPLVNLAYGAPNKNHYVSVSGRASLVQDKKKMEELWNPLYQAWFPKGKDDPSLALLKITVDKAEYWDSPGGLAVTLIGFTKAILTGQTFKPGEHRKFDQITH